VVGTIIFVKIIKMKSVLLSIYEIGEIIGPASCYLFVIIMAIGMGYCMKKYLN
jgi:hypothetical protein